MRYFIKSLVAGMLGVAGKFPTGITPRDELLGLMSRLHPVAPRQPLIRLGPDGDGGYLLPDDLDGIEACFSPGVSLISGFERDCADRRMQVFMADRSVDGPAEAHPNFHFVKKFIGATSQEGFVTLDEWVSQSIRSADSELLLQIDIERYEYEAFLSASDALMRRFRIIVAEFHDLDQMWSQPFFRLAQSTFDKILQTHRCVHLHPNNCCGWLWKDGVMMPRFMEFTFVRKDRLGDIVHRTDFPHALDFDNTSNRTLPLPACWYRQR
jgi:hypothetical protein